MAITVPTNTDTDDYAYTVYNSTPQVSFYIVRPASASQTYNLKPVVGDFIAVFVVKDDDAGGGITPPTDMSFITAPTAGAGKWDEWFDVGFTAGDDLRIAGFFTEVTTLPGSDDIHTFTLGESEEALLIAFIVKDADASDFTDSVTPASGTTQNVDGSPDADPPGVTTNTDDAMVITVVANRSDSEGHLYSGAGGITWDVDPPSGFTMQSGAATAVHGTNSQGMPYRIEQGTGNGDVGLSWAYKTVASNGSENPGVWTGFAGGRDMHMVTVAIKPAAASNDKSGTGSITETHSVTASGKKAVSGTASITHTHSTVATGAGFETHSGTAAITQTHTVTATGDAAETHSGSASIIATHVVTATGDKGGEGDGDVAHSHAVAAVGKKAASFDASITAGHTMSATGVAAEFHVGAGSIVETHSVVAAGVKGGEGAGSVVHGHAVTATGTAAEAHSGAGSIVETHTVTATGTKWEDWDKSGTAEITHSHAVTASGVKKAAGTGSIAQSHSVTATGVKSDSDDKSGAGAIVAAHTVTAFGVKDASGAGTVVHGHAVTAAGDATELHSGSGSIVETHSVVATGVKKAAGTGSITQGHTVTATGVKDDGGNDKSGSGTITQGHTVVATGVATFVEVELKGFRFRDGTDDALLNEDDHWGAVLNTDLTGIDVSANYDLRLRLLVENDGTVDVTAGVWRLQYRVNTGTWEYIGTGSGVSDDALSGQYALYDATTQLIGSGAFTAGMGVEGQPWITPVSLAVGDETEFEWIFRLVSADLSDGDVIDFRYNLYDDDWYYPTLTEMPSITVTKGDDKSGSGSIVETHSVTATGVKATSGSGSITQSHTVTASGVKDDSDDRSGSGSIAHTSVVSASGRKDVTGVATISHGHTSVATGQGFETHTGTASIVHSHIVTATGTKVTGEHRSGSGTITHGHAITATSTKNASGVAAVSTLEAVTGAGSKQATGTGTITVTVTLTADAYRWITMPRTTGRGLTDDGGPPGRTRHGQNAGVTDDGTSPGTASGLQSPGRTT